MMSRQPVPCQLPDALGHPAPSAGPLVAACASANLLLTLVSLDPSLPADHLSGWADGAIAVVTADSQRQCDPRCR
jgi:hypothetical protein